MSKLRKRLRSNFLYGASMWLLTRLIGNDWSAHSLESLLAGILAYSFGLCIVFTSLEYVADKIVRYFKRPGGEPQSRRV